jgi:hypothetical protein
MDSNINPVLKEICSSFYDFKRNYNLLNDNFFKSCILGNPNLVNEKRFALPVGNKFWSDKLNNPHGELDNIRICDLFTDHGRVKNIHQMGNTLLSNLDRDTYNAIKKVLETSMYVYNCDKVEITNILYPGISEFVTRFKKGSKNFRNIFTRVKFGKVANSKNKKIKTFFQLVDVFPDPELEKFQSEWAKGFYPMKVRDFIYKFRNNILGINTRVSHFANNVSRRCTFCVLANARNIEDETFSHLDNKSIYAKIYE